MDYKKLSLSHNRQLSGVCGGIADFLGWPAGRVRLLWFVLTFFTGGTLIIVYIICALTFPKPPKRFNLDDFRKQ